MFHVMSEQIEEYDEENCKLFLSEKPYVNGHLDADNVAKVIALVAPLELDREAQA